MGVLASAAIGAFRSGWHSPCSYRVSMAALRALEQRDGLSRLQGHHRLLPAGPPPDGAPDPLHLPGPERGADRGHVHAEEGLHRLLHLDLGGAAVDLEGVLMVLLAAPLGLLGDERALHDVLVREVHVSVASSFLADSAVSTRVSCLRMS